VVCQTTSSDAKQRGCSFIADKGWDCLCAAAG
jgi:hypothetical protein